MNERHIRFFTFEMRRTARLALFLTMLAAPALSQIRSGAAALRLVPGARHESMASALTGVVDELPAIYLNPAALGFSRQWHWSATYNKWIADTYQASFIGGRRLNFIGSRNTTMALGVTYLGMPDFDSTDGKAPAITANDLIAALALGQRFGDGPFAIGANVKYLRSRLANFEEQGLATDIGVLFRPARFQFYRPGAGLFEYAYFSAGLSLLNLGKDLTFAKVGTPLPRTWRGGVSFHAGKHHGMQLLVAADVSKARSERAVAAFGAELWWSGYAGVRLGYAVDEDRFVNNLTFGAGVQLIGLLNTTRSRWGRDNSAARLDFATSDKDELFGATYRGSLSHYPVLPESFNFIAPPNDELLYDGNPLLQWESSLDPDPFDNAKYLLLVATEDSAKIKHALNTASVDFEHLLNHSPEENYAVFANIDSNRYRMTGLMGGDYFWTVIAYDGDRHIRLAGPGNEHIRRFTVVDQNLMTSEGLPPEQWLAENTDVAITSVAFDPSPWITTTPEQGIVRVTIENRGRIKVDSLRVTLVDRFMVPADSSLPLLTVKDGFVTNPTSHDTVAGTLVVKDFAPNERRVIEFPWQTTLAGRHTLTASVDKSPNVPEIDESNNRLAEVFSTIPKGTVSCPPVSVALNISDLSNDVPFIAAAYFDKGSANVNADYLRRWPLTPPMKTLAERMKENPGKRIRLQGFADPLAGENSAALADQRSAAVRDELIAGGALPEQIKLLSGKVLPARRLPANAEDREAVLQERRCVNIIADSATNAVLFQPISIKILDSTFTPVGFVVNIKAGEPVTSSALLIHQPRTADSLLVLAPADSTQRAINYPVEWDVATSPDPGDWIGNSFAYQIHVQDALGRHFRTRESIARLDSARMQVRHQIYGPAKFGRAEPLYEFYWGVLFSELSKMLQDKSLRVRFIGHACSIGSLAINEKLSHLRAAKFRERFLDEIRQRMPESYAELQDRVDLAVGLGETVPLRIDKDVSTRVLVGNNRSPLGRVLNRRIEVTFYTPIEQLTSAEPRVE
jgi:outer membrane protein OmpA-like peptidoglycan-associated protein